jgi:hypothetical protein
VAEAGEQRIEIQIAWRIRDPPGCRDQLLDAGGAPLPHAASLMAALARLGPRP